jgi:hypothetical protein
VAAAGFNSPLFIRTHAILASASFSLYSSITPSVDPGWSTCSVAGLRRDCPISALDSSTANSHKTRYRIEPRAAMDDTSSVRLFTKSDGKPDEVVMQLHILRCVRDLLAKSSSSSTAHGGRVSSSFARRCVFFGALRRLPPGGEDRD